AAHPREPYLDAFETTDRRLELRAHPRIAAGRAHRELRHPGARRRQRDAAARGEALHQHPPAAPEHWLAADDPLHRDEDVATAVRAVLEHGVQRHVPAGGLDSRLRGGNERAGDADVFLVADEMIGVVRAEREAEQRCHRTQRDVALLPGHAKAEHALAVVLAPADDAVV